MRSNKVFNFASVFALAVFALSGCGQRISGNYTLTQSGLAFSQSGCQQISLAITENNNQVSGSGSNQCFTETITGTSNGGVMQVQVMISPISQSSGYSQPCTYSGQLSVSGNQVSGTLSSMNAYGGGYSQYGYNNYNGYNNTGYSGGGCSGTLQISGTRN